MPVWAFHVSLGIWTYTAALRLGKVGKGGVRLVMPLPDSGALTSPPSELVTSSEAALIVVVTGEKVRLIVQLEPAARAAGNVPQSFVCENSAESVPLRAIPSTLMVAVPRFSRAKSKVL